jgi:hypothetical protein
MRFASGLTAVFSIRRARDESWDLGAAQGLNPALREHPEKCVRALAPNPRPSSLLGAASLLSRERAGVAHVPADARLTRRRKPPSTTGVTTQSGCYGSSRQVGE